jgi:hypothetical protein
VICGLLVDVLARVLRPEPSALVRYRTFAALAGLVTWAGYLVVAYAADGDVPAPTDTGLAHPEAVVELASLLVPSARDTG